MALDYFPCYSSYYKKTKNLSDSELGRLFRALMKYQCTGETEQLNGREGMAFDFMVDDIDRAAQSYEDKCQKLRENGQKGANAPNSPQKPPKAPQSKDKDKDKDKSESNADADSAAERIMNAWNELPLPHIEGIPKGSQREKMLSARIRDHGGEKVLAAIEEVKTSDFLLGKDGKWSCTFDWLIAPTNFQKVIEGNYRNKGFSNGIQPSGKLGAAELEAIQRVLRDGQKPGRIGNYPPGKRPVDADEEAAIRRMMEEE